MRADLPSPKTVLEVLDSPQAAKAACCHDAYAGTQRFTLLHAVGRQDDCVTCKIRFQAADSHSDHGCCCIQQDLMACGC